MASCSKPGEFIGEFVVNAANTPESDANTIFTFIVVDSRVESLEEIKILWSPSRWVAPPIALHR